MKILFRQSFQYLRCEPVVLNSPLVIQLDHLRTGPDDKLEVVGNHKHDHAGSGQLLNQPADPHHGVIVQAAGGLVKIYHRAVLDDGRANGDPLLLPAGEGRRVLLPASKISNLSQGMFVGSVSDNVGETIKQKIFHARIVMDNAQVEAETRAYKPIPVITDFTGGDGKDHMQEEIECNYYRIKEEVGDIIRRELLRIENDPKLRHLLETDEE